MIYNYRLLCTYVFLTATNLSCAVYISVPVDITVINQSDHYIWLGHIKEEVVVDKQTFKTRSQSDQQRHDPGNQHTRPTETETTSYYERKEERKSAIVTIPPKRQFTYSQTSSYSSWFVFHQVYQPQGFYISNLNLNTSSFLKPTVTFGQDSVLRYNYLIKEDQWLSFADHQLNVHPSYIEHTITIS